MVVINKLGVSVPAELDSGQNQLHKQVTLLFDCGHQVGNFDQDLEQLVDSEDSLRLVLVSEG